jgi:hypothetical protein
MDDKMCQGLDETKIGLHKGDNIWMQMTSSNGLQFAINENKWQLSSSISTLNPCTTSYNHVIIK